MWGGAQEGTTTRVGVEVAVFTVLGIIGLLLFNPLLGPSVSVLLALVLVGLDTLVILALLGVFPRVRSWWSVRRVRRRLNGHPTLVAEMVRLVQRTHDTLYQNGYGTLVGVTRSITQTASHVPDEVLRYGRTFQMVVDMSQTRTPWDPNMFAGLVRGALAHFDTANYAIGACYAIATHVEGDTAMLAQWEHFRERYNQLRSEWQRLSDEMLAVIGLSAPVPGEPVRQLVPAVIRPWDPAKDGV